MKKYNIPIDGKVNNAKKCTPKESPITNEIKITHLFPLSVSSSSSHFRPNQNNKAINKEAIEYTSASTALNQKLSVNVKDKAAIKDAPRVSFAVSLFHSEVAITIFRTILDADQNINNIVKALENTETIFTIKAI